MLTSATLAVRGSFDHIIGSLGLGTVHTQVLPSPFEQLSENHLMVLTDYLPAPRARLIDEFTHAAVREIGRLLLLAGGRGLVLSTARDRMQRTRDHLRPILESHGMPLLAQGDAPAPALVERMRSEMATSLLAVRSFWEGVDIPGEALSLLILEKVPFDSPADPIVNARMQALECRGKDPFADYAVPESGAEVRAGRWPSDPDCGGSRCHRGARQSCLPGDCVARPGAGHAAWTAHTRAGPQTRSGLPLDRQPPR